MKITIVPAQITTVEDKIVGNLNFTQILLLIAALFVSTMIYLVLPQPIKFTPYKLPLMVLSSAFLLTLAIRIKGKVILQWIILIATYTLRPRFYVFNKNDTTFRDIIFEQQIKKVKAHAKQKVKAKETEKAALITDVIAMEQVLLNPNKHIRLAFKKGGIHGIVSENQ